MRQWIADLIIPMAEFIRNLVSAVPMIAVRLAVFGVLSALAIWVLLLGPQKPDAAGERGKFGLLTDLRFFALAVLGLQILLYIIF